MVLSERSESKGFKMFFVYILRTSSNRLYVGVTANLNQRISAHSRGKGAEWLKAGPPGPERALESRRGDLDAHLVYSEPHPTLGSARKREIQLKKWSRKKKEALISGDLANLKSLSRCRSTLPLGLAHDCASLSHSKRS
jgi:putative endonuclease